MTNKAKLLNAAVAGLLATGGASILISTNAVAAATGECHGVNACKGHGACGGAGNGCAGKNACKGQGWIESSEADCKSKAKDMKLEASKWSWKAPKDAKGDMKTEEKKTDEKKAPTKS